MSSKLEEQLSQALAAMDVSKKEEQAVIKLLDLLKKPATYLHYEHSIRVGLLAQRVAKFLDLQEKSLFYAGLLHDLGKSKTPPGILNKTELWTVQDYREIKKHVIDGYRLLIKNGFDFTASIILWHHRFQAERSYPQKMPPKKHLYSRKSQNIIMIYGKLLAIIDVYDAMHRDNGRINTKEYINSAEMKERLIRAFPDQNQLIESLYKEEIFI